MGLSLLTDLRVSLSDGTGTWILGNVGMFPRSSLSPVATWGQSPPALPAVSPLQQLLLLLLTGLSMHHRRLEVTESTLTMAAQC